MKQEQTSEKIGIMKQAQIIEGTGIEKQEDTRIVEKIYNKGSSDIGIKHP